MVTAWIDDDGKYFEFPFNSLMILSNGLPIICNGMISKYKGKKKIISEIMNSFCIWCGVCGDMSESKAQELLDDITTDGQTIESEIKKNSLTLQNR